MAEFTRPEKRPRLADRFEDTFSAVFQPQMETDSSASGVQTKQPGTNRVVGKDAGTQTNERPECFLLTKLPLELVNQILDQCPARALQRLRGTNRFFRRHIAGEIPRLTRRILEREHDWLTQRVIMVHSTPSYHDMTIEEALRDAVGRIGLPFGAPPNQRLLIAPLAIKYARDNWSSWLRAHIVHVAHAFELLVRLHVDIHQSLTEQSRLEIISRYAEGNKDVWTTLSQWLPKVGDFQATLLNIATKPLTLVNHAEIPLWVYLYWCTVLRLRRRVDEGSGHELLRLFTPTFPTWPFHCVPDDRMLPGWLSYLSELENRHIWSRDLLRAFQYKAGSAGAPFWAGGYRHLSKFLPAPALGKKETSAAGDMRGSEQVFGTGEA